jgi:hypothetical protein
MAQLRHLLTRADCLGREGAVAVLPKLLFPARRIMLTPRNPLAMNAELAGNGAAIASLFGQADGLPPRLRRIGFSCGHWASLLVAWITKIVLF